MDALYQKVGDAHACAVKHLMAIKNPPQRVFRDARGV